MFVSYSRRDLEVVDQVAAALTRSGVPIWIDRRDIPVSVPWFEEVTAGIEEAALFVVCDSPDWRASTACELEHRAAEDARKAVLVTDLRELPPEATAERIIAAYRALPPEVRTHTEVSVRASTWRRSGRAARALISGSLLKQARALSRRGTPPLTPDGLDFVRSSLRRQSRRRWIAWPLGILGVLTLLSCGTATVVRGYANATFRSADTSLSNFVPAEEDYGRGPYEILAEARGRFADGSTGYLGWIALTDALNTPVPDLSFTVPGRTLQGFGSAVVPDDVTVVDTQGRHYGARGVRPAGKNQLRPATPGRAVSPDGTLVAVRSAAGTVRVTRASDGTLLRAVAVPGAGPVLSFGPDDRTLAVGTGPDVTLIDATTGVRLTTLAGSIGDVRALAWSSSGRRVWAIAGTDRVTGWRWRTGTVVSSDPARSFTAVAGPRPDGTLVAASRDGRLTTIDPARPAAVTTVPTSARDVVALAVSPTGDVALGGTGKIWIRSATGRERMIAGGCGGVRLAYDGTGARLYATCLTPEVTAFDAATGQPAGSARLDANSQAFGIAADHRGNVFVGTSYGEIVRFDAGLREQTVLRSSSCGMPIRSLAASTDGRIVAAGGDGSAHLGCVGELLADGHGWDSHQHQQPPGSGELVRAVAVTADGGVGVRVFSDGRVRFWRPGETLDPGGEYHQLGSEALAVTFTGDGKQVLVGTRDGVLELLPACPLCGTEAELSAKAAAVLARAHTLGLTEIRN